MSLLKIVALILSLVVLAALAPVTISGEARILLLIDGVPSERFIMMFHGEDGVVESGPGGGLVAVAVGASVAIVDSVKDSVIGVINLSEVGWGRTVSLAWVGNRVVAVNASCGVAVISLANDMSRINKLINLGEGLRAAGVGGYVGDSALILCGSSSGPVLAVLNVSNGLYRLIKVRELVSAGNPVFGRGPLLDNVTGRVYFSGVARSGEGFVHGIYYLEPSELLGDEAVPHLLYGVVSLSDWYTVGVRDVGDGMVLADVNGSLVLVDGGGAVRALVSLPWFYGDALFYRPTGLVAVTFRERYDVEWVAIYDLEGGLVRGLFMRGSVLRLAVASGKIYTLEPCVPGRDDYLALYSLAYRGIGELVSSDTLANVSGDSVRIGVVRGLAPGELHTWVSAYLDPETKWWEAVYTTHIHYNGSLYNTVVVVGEGSTGSAFVIDELATRASPVPGEGVVIAGVLVEAPSYARMRQWFVVDVSSGRALTILEVGADPVKDVQALSTSEWVSYGRDEVRLYLVSDGSALSKILGPGVTRAFPVEGTDYVVYERGSHLFIEKVSVNWLTTIALVGLGGVGYAAYNPADDTLLVMMTDGHGTDVLLFDISQRRLTRELDISGTVIPLVPVDDGVLGISAGNGRVSLVLVSMYGEIDSLAREWSCNDPSPMGYFASPRSVGVAVGCSSRVIIWAGEARIASPPTYLAWAGAAAIIYLIALLVVRLRV